MHRKQPVCFSYFWTNNISMKTLFSALLLASSFTSFSQYYYKDIISNKETEKTIQAYKTNNVTKVVLNSFDADGTRSDDFFVQQSFNPAAAVLVTITRSGVTNASVLSSYINSNGQVLKTTDSTANMLSHTTYTYNNSGMLTTVTMLSTDSANTLNETEEHLWQYTNNNITRMLRIKNKKDTTIVNFKLDDNGNVIEEQSTRNGKITDAIYYYYDAKNRLTDIVRFNNKAKRLLPEYMFEYSPENQVIQRITVPANNSDYLIWRFLYNDKGLKVKEAVYDKHKQLSGTIQYQYSFQ